MYIKLGSINLHYYQETNDWMILGEVIDSGMSYEKPILVRTTEELDIWFGKDFKDYSYLQELINMGVVLYLFKPISDETSGDSSYINLDDYTEDDSVWINEVEIDWLNLILNDPEKYKFRYNNGEETLVMGFKIDSGGGLSLINDVQGREFCTEDIMREELPPQISKIYKTAIKFHVYNSESLWIFKDEILNIDLLPQNINLTSTSSNNRDTLILSSPEDTIEFTYLDYNNWSDEFGIFSNTEIVDFAPSITSLNNINMEKVVEGYQSLILILESTALEIGDNDYFVIPGSSGGEWKLYCKDIDNIPPDIKSMFRPDNIETVDTFSNLITRIKSQGYKTKIIDGKTYIFSKSIIPITNFYKSDTVSIKPDIKSTELILSKYIETGAEIVSKTIGRCSEFGDDLIKLEIINTEGTSYRVSVSRYSYTEVFEGDLKGVLGVDSLDSKISKESNLIRCHFYGDKLREGTYYLRGAIKENESPEMFQYALESMLSPEYSDPVYPDYFMIPDKTKYTSDITTNTPFTLFLDYSKAVGCQFLIENNSSDELYNIVEVDELPTNRKEGTYYKVGDLYYDWEGNLVTDPEFNDIVLAGGDFVYNYTNDEENRLIYFFKKMTSNYEPRPAYYLYLMGLLTNEYSMSVNNILYKTPTEDAFLEYNIEKQLENYKSNYLVCDNQTYFYKKYQDGNKYITTGWTRFIIGKIYRELQKNSGEILGQQLLGKIRSKISDLLMSITSSFSIVRSIDMTDFEQSDTGESIKVIIETIMNDLVNNDVSLDITVNYNNNNITYGTIS